MQRSWWICVLVAGALLAAGCSSSNGSAASPATPAVSSSAASSSSTGSDGAAGAAGSGSAASRVPPAVLDDQTTRWFEAVCSGLGPSIKSLNSLEQASTSDPSAQQSAAVGALQGLQTAFSSTASTLAAMAPPTFDGGAQFAGTLSTGLQSTATQLGAVAAKFAAVDPSDTAALSAAASGLQTELNTALQPLESINQLQPAVSEAVSAIPSCKSLGN